MRGIAAAQKAFKNLEKLIGAAGLEPTTYTYFLEIILKVIYTKPPSNNKKRTPQVIAIPYIFSFSFTY